MIYDIWFKQNGQWVFFYQHTDEEKAKYDVDFFLNKGLVIKYTKRTPEEERQVRIGNLMMVHEAI